MSNGSVLRHLFSFSLESEVRCSDNDRHLDMTESSSSSLRSRVLPHAMDAQHRKCNREHQGIPDAPQARCSAAGPLPSEPVRELATTTTFWRRGMCLVILGNCATLHLSVLDAHAVRAVLPFDFVFFTLFSSVFPVRLQTEQMSEFPLFYLILGRKRY